MMAQQQALVIADAVRVAGVYLDQQAQAEVAYQLMQAEPIALAMDEPMRFYRVCGMGTDFDESDLLGAYVRAEDKRADELRHFIAQKGLDV